ncbi:lactonase family protein [Streptomyces beihaiensis]|uniref:Lactonase family protein n=1 Tax=Streptomyces beihaiensis TaxID=2984495 RepID=A0ABT3TUE6_9ACTN|nr:lactonase family protein [Streptomyces beihaiensis]MCX3060151.1 lactonase family protein [Streptomyces beihaiensis]
MSDGRQGRAYIGSFTAAGGRGIVTAAVDAADGALTVLDATDALPDPSFLALSGEMLYAVSETDDGSVAALRTSAGAAPALAAPSAPVGGAGPTHLAVWHGHVLTANYGSGSVSTVRLRPDGTPDPARRHVLRHSGCGPHPQRQRAPHAHQILPDPSGRWALGVDLGTDSVRVCALADGGPGGPELTVHRETALRPGSGPRHLAFHPSGHHVYVLNELAPTLTVCRWDGALGLLEPIAEVPVLPGAARGDAYPSAVVVAPDGRCLWTATRGEDVISVLALDATGERVALRTTTPCGGRWPRDLALHPSSRFLYAANERSGDVSWFTLDARTGAPARGGSVRVPAATCVVLG